MSFTVRWVRRAEADLIALFIRAADKDAVTLYTQGADQILSRDPMEQGESRQVLAERLWFYRPLCLSYYVDEVGKVVFIVGVRWTGK